MWGRPVRFCDCQEQKKRMKTIVTNEQAKRPHIYELDPMRACTALGVVAVHALAFTAYLNSTAAGYQVQSAIVVALHYTREIFIFVTAFALVYVYRGRFTSPLQFWKKRALGVLFPYVVWSLIYTLVNTSLFSPGSFLQTGIFDILTGSASYQLYYILLTLQFYLAFPLFLPFILKCARRPWLTLGISFAFQVILFAVDFHTIQHSNNLFWETVANYQDRFLLVYQFYFVLGGLAAYYFQQVRAFVLRYAWQVTGVFLLFLGGLWLHFALQVLVYHETIGYASSVLQPVMVFYSIAVVGFALMLVCRWVERAAPGERPRFYHFWHLLSDASFGVYLIHALILDLLLRQLVPLLPTTWLEPLRVFLVWFLTAGSSMAMTILLLNIPYVSRLVGRSTGRSKPKVPAVQPQKIPAPQPQKMASAESGVK